MSDAKPPDEIYLQCDDDGSTDDKITWCRDKINDQDIKYVRAPSPIALQAGQLGAGACPAADAEATPETDAIAFRHDGESLDTKHNEAIAQYNDLLDKSRDLERDRNRLQRENEELRNSFRARIEAENAIKSRLERELAATQSARDQWMAQYTESNTELMRMRKEREEADEFIKKSISSDDWHLPFARRCQIVQEAVWRHDAEDDEHEAQLSAKDAEIAALKKTSEMLSTNWTNTERLLAQARRAIGDHAAPADCYSTGPLTGDPIRDLVECHACTFIAADAARAEQGGKT